MTEGNWLVGGNGSLYSYNENYTASSVNYTAKYTSIDLSASVGYFITDKFSCGLRPYFSSFKGQSAGGFSTNNLKFALGPFARYYLLKADKPFNIITDMSYQFGVNQNFGGLNDKGKFNNFSLSGGIEAFFNSNVGLEILLGYSQRIVTIENSPVALNSNKKGFQASIGLTIHLEKNKNK